MGAISNCEWMPYTVAIMDATPRQTPPQSAEPDASIPHNLSVEEASQRFVDAGVPRSVRTIQRYCQVGYLNCISVQGELGSRYLVNADSIEHRITELQQVQALMGASASAPRRAMARHDASQRGSTRHDATHAAAEEGGPIDEETSTEIGKLKSEIRVLEIDKRVRDELISRLDTDRQKLMTTLTDQSRLVGRLETELRLLTAPKNADDNPQAGGVEVTNLI